MKFDTPLLRGRLVRRYKRFLADVTLDGDDVLTAHCANSGSMLGVSDPGSTVWLSRSGNPKRKLPLTLEMVETEGTLVGVNTNVPNRLAEEAVADGLIRPLAGYGSIRREVRYGRNSRIDLLLEGHPDDPRPAYVEVKNVHMRRPERFDGRAAEFPDSVTTRGAKHLRELADMVAEGHRAVMLFIVQRNDCDYFRPADDIDPAYASGLAAARDAGVELLCVSTTLSPEAIRVDRALDIRI